MNEEQAIKYIDNMYQKRMESIETKEGVICLRELKNVEFTDLELAGLILLRYNHFKDNEITNLQQENTQLKQQLKDKDEKISNLIKLLVEMVFDDTNDLGVYQELVARHLVKLGYIVKEDGFYKELETNKED